MIHSWLQKKAHSSFTIYALSSKIPISHIQKPRLISFKTRFDHSSSFRSPTLYINIFLPSDPHIVKKSRIWTTSLGLYLEPVVIWLDLIPDNFQLTVTSSSWTDSIYLFMTWLKLLSANFRMTMKSSSHTPVTETRSKDNSPPKISSAIILFLLVDTSWYP